MKHVTFADKSLLLGDEAADLLLEYGTALTNAGSGDTVELNAVGADGDEVVATFLLDPGISLLAETTTSTAVEPDNSHAVTYMREQIQRLGPHRVQTSSAEPDSGDWEEWQNDH